MSQPRSSESKSPEEPPRPEGAVAGPGQRLTEPGPIEPGPEGQWPFPATTPAPDVSGAPGPATPPATPDPSEERTLVDPRPGDPGPEPPP